MERKGRKRRADATDDADELKTDGSPAAALAPVAPPAMEDVYRDFKAAYDFLIDVCLYICCL